MLLLNNPRCELDEKRAIIRLCFGIECRAISAYLSAFFTLVDYYKLMLCIRLWAYRTEQSTAFVCSVSGIYVDVEWAEAKRAVVARTFTHRLYLTSAICAYKRTVVFCKSFLFHIILQEPSFLFPRALLLYPLVCNHIRTECRTRSFRNRDLHYNICLRI